MKIGILTFVHTSNYGALFQAYALQTLLSQIDVRSEIIDYQCPTIQNAHAPNYIWKRHGIGIKLVFPVMYWVYRKRLESFYEFEKKYMRFSGLQYDRNSICKIEDQYYKVLVGSDQVWNPLLTEGDMTYFLDFLQDRSKKVSYAASFGTRIFPEQYRKQCGELLKDFYQINVREKSSQRALKKIGICAESVLEPTLMIDAEHWKKLVNKRPYSGKYIFLYMIPETAEIISQIVNYAKTKEYKLFLVRKGIRRFTHIKVLNTLSPEDFLTYLFHADIVITGSLHGICFSVLFQKQFFVTRSVTEHLSGRIDDVLELLGLQSQKWNISDDNGRTINYKIVQEQLNKQRELSAVCLRDAVK